MQGHGELESRIVCCDQYSILWTSSRGCGGLTHQCPPACPWALFWHLWALGEEMHPLWRYHCLSQALPNCMGSSWGSETREPGHDSKKENGNDNVWSADSAWLEGKEVKGRDLCLSALFLSLSLILLSRRIARLMSLFNEGGSSNS